MRRAALIIATAAVFAIPVTAAEAAFQSGTYKGKSDQGIPVTLKVAKNKKFLTATFNAIAECDDGSLLFDPDQPFTIRRMPVKKNGSFGGSAQTAGGSDGYAKYTIVGKLKGRRATGRPSPLGLLIQYFLSDGSTCDSQRANGGKVVGWSAKR